MVMDFETFISEGLIRTYPIDKMVDYIRKKYNFTDEEIDIERKSIMIDTSDVNKNVLKDVLETINKMNFINKMKSFVSQETWLISS